MHAKTKQVYLDECPLQKPVVKDKGMDDQQMKHPCIYEIQYC